MCVCECVRLCVRARMLVNVCACVREFTCMNVCVSECVRVSGIYESDILLCANLKNDSLSVFLWVVSYFKNVIMVLHFDILCAVHHLAMCI
jgi:hypothetical protein